MSNVQRCSGTSALISALQQRNVAAVQILIESGADVNHANHANRKSTPLYLAVKKLHFNSQVAFLEGSHVQFSEFRWRDSIFLGSARKSDGNG